MPDQDNPLDLERYRPLLRVAARQLHLDPRLRPRFDGSDVVQEAMVRALAARQQFRGNTERELVCWLSEILHHTVVDLVRRERALQRNPELEASLAVILADSAVRMERVLVRACEKIGSPTRKRGVFSEFPWLRPSLARRASYFFTGSEPRDRPRCPQETLLRWAQAVETLPAEQRDVVLLRDLHGLTVA